MKRPWWRLTVPCSLDYCLREKTVIEKRLDAVESGQEVQDGAIVELAGIVAGGEV